MINLLHLGDFYPVIIPTSLKERESDELLYTVRSLVTVRNRLPAQVVKNHARREYLAPNCNFFIIINLVDY